MTGDPAILAEISAGLRKREPLSDLLRLTIELGAESGSTRLKEWALHELSGYTNEAEIPPYRVVAAPVLVDGIAGWNQISHQQIDSSWLPREMREGSDRLVQALDGELKLTQSVAELEAASAKGQSIQLGLPGGQTLARLFNSDTQQVTRIYWSLSPLTVAGVLDRIRTSLTQLIAELRSAVPRDARPTAQQADQAFSIAIEGKRNTVVVTTQSTGGGSATAAQAAGKSSITTESSGESEKDPSWWTRGRKIGAIIVGAATIIGALITVLTYLNS